MKYKLATNKTISCGKAPRIDIRMMGHLFMKRFTIRKTCGRLLFTKINLAPHAGNERTLEIKKDYTKCSEAM